MLFILSLKYVCLASEVLASVPKCCAHEISKLSLFAVYDGKRWANLAEEIQHTAPPYPSMQKVAPYPGKLIVLAGKYFAASFPTGTEFNKEIVSAQINQSSCNEVFPTGV